ncbi:MAG: hypothetical protein JSW30_01900 [Dehalococcoidia bacterium]|nr:MAG: hypothetical protein JSW30_01900 [Dehalococcoidia bacterium]
MGRAWMPTVAGILDIICAGLHITAVFGLIIAMIAVESNPYLDPAMASGGVPVNITAILGAILVTSAIAAVLALVGGIYALKRQKWGLALAGAIAAFFPVGILGVVAIVLTALSRQEFES